MNIVKKLSISSENIIRKKPYDYKDINKNLFKNEFTKNLPHMTPIENEQSYIPPCGRLFNGISFNLFQFNTKVSLTGLLKSYLKSILFLIKIRKITKFDKVLYVTNSNSHNFFHWFLDVLQKIEFININKDEILNSKFKIVIPNGHDNNYSKKSLEAFDLDFYFQSKSEIIVSRKSILIPDVAPTGNYRKKLVLKLRQRLRDFWLNKKKITSKKKRIYISRKNSETRRLKNEDEILTILAKYEFDIVDFDKLSFEDQLRYAVNSEIIVSAHGAGLTHMLWMKKKSKVLEIRTKNNCHDNCYFSLASDLGHDYFYIQADKTEPNKSNHISDLVINKNDFSSKLLEMF